MKAASMGEGKKSKWKARSSTRHCWGTRLWRSETYLFRESLAAKALRANPQLSQISEVVFVCTRYGVFPPAFYTQPVLPGR